VANDKHYLFELDRGVAVVTFNRPEKMNPIDWELGADLCALFRELREQDEVRVIVLTGAGGNFSAGGDIDWLSGSGERVLPGLSGEEAERDMPRYQRKTPAGAVAEFTRMIIEVDKPVIAALEGNTMGAGLAFALACDRRFGDPTTRMCAAMVRLGFAPDCGVTYFLAKIARLPMALRMVETGDIIAAEECYKEGLIDELVGEGESLEAAKAYARRLAEGPSVAVDLARRFVHKALGASLDEMLDYEAIASTLSSHTADALEGTSAFVERRKPDFKGH
jgi:2-(1,2-epoxy-1,2-dihydrophenyl)acetyl-CoA isomerase